MIFQQPFATYRFSLFIRIILLYKHSGYRLMQFPNSRGEGLLNTSDSIFLSAYMQSM